MDDVKAATSAAVREVCGADGIVTCRITHAYPDGAAPYFTVVAPARRGEEVDQWDATPEPATIQRIIANHQRFFASFRCTA